MVAFGGSTPGEEGNLFTCCTMNITRYAMLEFTYSKDYVGVLERVICESMFIRKKYGAYCSEDDTNEKCRTVLGRGTRRKNKRTRGNSCDKRRKIKKEMKKGL